ncbi:MAG TPA: hypothetical protein VF631_07395 [Allosphingosinicella sp.]|jgi:hypothetical protein|uniref:hypothetical protein n=1 Tax=Allosphingosinicella sp. TaxID=2823234 RepID=UPI002F2A089C
MGDVSTIRFLEISADQNQAAIYSRMLEVDVGDRDYREMVEEAVRQDDFAALGSVAEPSLDAAVPPERFLDIDMGHAAGVHAIVFRIEPARAGLAQLEFIETSPFMLLPTNDPDGESFLSRLRTYPDGNRRWASFMCDLDHARSSQLADRVRAVPAQAHAATRHGRAMRIPFILNVVDQELQFSPWVLPYDTEGGFRSASFFTHGGVHPPSSIYLKVDV